MKTKEKDPTSKLTKKEMFIGMDPEKLKRKSKKNAATKGKPCRK
ncbi:MAG: hypothetical protein WCO63_01395 [Bacteroidota bacterium]